MVVVYSILTGAMTIPLLPLLYMKVITNSVFISMANKRENYKGENTIQLLIASFLSPVIIPLSILIDLLSLPNIIFKDSKGFERKYQQSEDRLNDAQIDVVMITFEKIFYG